MTLTRYTALIILLATAILGCKEEHSRVTQIRLQSPLSVTHLTPITAPLDDPPYPHMWYYRTELRNDSNRDLRVIWFEAYFELDGVWYPSNALGRVLRSKEFSLWYAEGDPIIDGVISPSTTAVCDVNWHGNQTDTPLRTKWAYIAVDEFGFDYYVESEVSFDILKHVYQSTTSAEDLPTAPSEPQQAQQGGAGQPATRPLSDSEGSYKPQPESEGRSR
jgi:hypothetical protein